MQVIFLIRQDDRKPLRMKSTAKQEHNLNFKRNSYIPKMSVDPCSVGSTTLTAPQSAVHVHSSAFQDVGSSEDNQFIYRYDTHIAQEPGSLFCCHAVVGELAIHSCPFLCLQRQVAKFASGLFYCIWSLLCNNTMATNLLMLASHYDTRRFATCDCWTQMGLVKKSTYQTSEKWRHG